MVSKNHRNLKLAKLGENLVSDKLVAAGWKILARNFRRKGSEIDIIAAKGRTISFVEVKTRTKVGISCDIMRLASHHKQLSLSRGVMAFVQEGELTNKTLRLDLAVVYSTKNGGLKLQAYLPDFAPIISTI